VGSTNATTLPSTNGTSSTSAASTGALNFTGLASGVDTASIIQGIEAIANQQISSLQSQGNGIASVQALFSALQGSVYSLQSATNQLALSAGGAFDARTATPSNTSAMTAAAGTAAVPGTYSLTISALAQANEVASQGYADPNTTLQQGTMTIQVGSGAPITVTLNSQNNTLQGLASAINSANGGVQASVISDGSATPYHLLLTASSTGAANTISVTNNLTSGTGASIDPTNTTVQAAADAQITLGSATSGLTITSATNQVNDLIPGVTLNLLQANPQQSVTLTVANDTSGAATAMQNFVSAYNTVVDFINNNSTFNTATQQGGPLLGNQTASNLRNALAAALSAATGGGSSSVNSLASVGLSFNQTGDLQFDQAKFTSAMNAPGGPTAVKQFFSMSGKSDNPGVQFVLGGTKTQPSGSAAYQVQITNPASRGAMTSSTALASSISIDGTNDTFSIKVDGATSAPITIPAGTYTPTQLATTLQQLIDTSSSLGGNLVAMGLTPDGKLQITSQSYGSASQVAIGTGSAVGATGPLGFSGTENGNGADVTGNFVVNGKTEAATGNGQYLIGNAGNANTDGLEVQSTLSVPGTASLGVTAGIATQLNNVLNSYLDPVNGQFTNINNQYQTVPDPDRQHQQADPDGQYTGANPDHQSPAAFCRDGGGGQQSQERPDPAFRPRTPNYINRLIARASSEPVSSLP
jgi:flagellar hook-associated protein 2